MDPKVLDLMKKMEEESKQKLAKPSVLDGLPKFKRSLSDNFDNDMEKMGKDTEKIIKKFEVMFGIENDDGKNDGDKDESK